MTNALTISIIFIYIAFSFSSCTFQSNETKKWHTSEKEFIDSTLIIFDSTNLIDMKLYIHPNNKISNYIYLQLSDSSLEDNNISFKIPCSSSEYGYGVGFSNTFVY